MKKKYTFGQIPKTDNRLKDINGKCAMKRLFGPRIFSDWSDRLYRACIRFYSRTHHRIAHFAESSVQKAARWVVK